MTTAYIDSIRGFYIKREDFNKLIANNKYKWSTREVLPPKTPAAFKMPKTIPHYRAIAKGDTFIGIARGHKHDSIFSTIETTFNAVDSFPKNLPSKECIAPHQRLIINETIKRINKDKYGDVLIQLDTGLGKTRLACYLAGKIGLKTLIIVPTKHIALQWNNELQTMFKGHSITISQYTNAMGENSDFNFSIVIVNTAFNKKLQFYSQFGLVIFDEVHEYVSTKKKYVLWESSNVKYRIGLSATPEYAGYGLLPYLEGHLGKTMYASELPNFSVDAKNFSVKIHAVYHKADSNYTMPILNKTGAVSIMETLSKILEDPERMELVILHIINLYKNDNNIIVFAEHRAYIDKLSELLGEKSIILKGGVDCRTVHEGHVARIILTTYGYSRRGIDYSQLNAIVLATPRRNGIKQIIGRILRYNSDASIPRIIVDIVDCNTIVMGQYYARKKIYNERGYSILC